MTQKSIHPEDIMLNIYAPNNTTSKHMKQKLTKLKKETDNFLLEITTPLSQ